MTDFHELNGLLWGLHQARARGERIHMQPPRVERRKREREARKAEQRAQRAAAMKKG